MYIIQPQQLEYKLKLSQTEVDLIAHALGITSDADRKEAMPHYKRELEGFDNVSMRLYNALTQIVSSDSIKSIGMAAD
tara:strand:+ start:527 stop:760 length:234 start_codon:yes stop_codon:yes gene_type:complete